MSYANGFNGSSVGGGWPSASLAASGSIAVSEASAVKLRNDRRGYWRVAAIRD